MNIAKIAKLANIKLTLDEEKTYSSQIETILNYLKVLETVNTKDTKPTFQISGLTNQTREDIVKPSQPLSGYIIAPKTVSRE